MPNFTDYHWVGGSLSDPTSWQPNSAEHPFEPDTTNSVTIDGFGTVSGSLNVASAYLGNTFDLEGSITTTQGIYITGGTVSVGMNGSLDADGGIQVQGPLEQNGGTLTSNNFSINIDGGSYVLRGGSMLSNGGELVGNIHDGTMVQKGGKNTTNLLYVQSGGHYQMSGGQLNVGAQHEFIAAAPGKHAVFIQNGGKHTIIGDLSLLGQGTTDFFLGGGTLAEHSAFIGTNGTSTFEQTGGTHTVADRIVLGIDQTNGALPGGNGTYLLGGTGSLSVQTIFVGSDPNCLGRFSFNVLAGDTAQLTISGTGGFPGLIVGGEGNGAFRQGGGNLTTSLSVGFRATGSGIYNLLGGHLTSQIEKIGDAGFGTLNQNGGDNTIVGTTERGLVVGSAAGSNGKYNLIAGTLNATQEIVGDAGKGAFVQTGSTNTITATGIYIGEQTGSDGRYELRNASTLHTENEAVGDFGVGTFIQFNAGSENFVNNVFSVGRSLHGKGTYTLKDGLLTTFKEFIGSNGTGAFHQTGGTNMAADAGFLGVGWNTDGVGHYKLDGGAVSARKEVIGNSGAGDFVQTAGTNTATNIYIGANDAAKASYELDGGTLTSSTEDVGYSGTGSFLQKGGTNTLTGFGLTLGTQTDGNGTFRLVNGTLTAKGENIGYNGTGTFTQTGGTNSVNTTNAVLDIGVFENSHGVYNLNGGVLNAYCENVGDAGIGYLVQRGGTNTVATLTIGLAGNPTAYGEYDLWGGSLSTGSTYLGYNTGSYGRMYVYHATLTTSVLAIGTGGIGIMNAQAGGVVSVGGDLQMNASSVLNSATGSVTIGAGLVASPGVIGIGTGGHLAGAGLVRGTVGETVDGLITAHGGALIFTGDISGGGKLHIDDHATLDLRAGDSNAVYFEGGAGKLILRDPSHFTGTLEHLTVGDVIDLANTKVTDVSIDGSTLDITLMGGGTLAFNLGSGIGDNVFVAQDDGHNGTNLLFQAPSATHPLEQDATLDAAHLALMQVQADGL